jgi:dolichol-phosphate mannosyltransferase
MLNKRTNHEKAAPVPSDLTRNGAGSSAQPQLIPLRKDEMPNITNGAVEQLDNSTVTQEDAFAERGSAPVVSIVLPTKNEQENIPYLFKRIEKELGRNELEVIVVDDSDDNTAEVARETGSHASYDVRVIKREQDERGGGLSSAVVAGARAAKAPWVCVMDADLQHPPEVVDELLRRAESGDVDVVVASRYCSDGSASGFGHLRAFVSRTVTKSASWLFPRRLRGVSDPMSGFFMFRRDSVDLDRLQPQGFKILLEILATHGSLRKAEVPFTFGSRIAGDSKASLRQGTIYLSQLVRLRLGARGFDLARFCVVGGVGLAVNMAAFVLFNAAFGLNYLLAAVLATQVSTTTNFVMTERWVFARRATGGVRPRALMYFALNNASLLLRGPILILLVEGLGVGTAVSNFLSLLVLTVIRFAVADSWIWRSKSSQGLHGYDVHGLVQVVSEVALPELEFFRTDDIPTQPSIRVRMGRLNRRQSDLVQALLSPALLRAKHLRYDEGLGPLGFSVELSAGQSFEVVATPLLRYSPHVLYTNVVEPVLRWVFVTKGYALVHGACICADGEATLITARTDTGKTTTILKVLDARSYEFLSDDLTLLSPDGTVLSYPKPLTISRHTLAAVSTPLLKLGERMRLVYQSRLHSRSGRRFAMLIARLRLPAATINGIVQFLVPPPKYPVNRLVPQVSLGREARLKKMYVIERGERAQVQLEPEAAAETLMANSQDAFGFPPYPTIEHFLTRHNGHDLATVEEEIVSQALEPVPALVLSSPNMDWWKHFVEQRVPAAEDGEELVQEDDVRAVVESGGSL